MRSGVTLLEMLVAVGILVVVILCVGILFAGTSRAVGTSQALMEMLSNARAIQEQLGRDVGAIDKNGFLVIRSAVDAEGVRHDEMAFTAIGRFRDRLNGGVAANAAHVWWGELVMKGDTSAGSESMPVGMNEMPTADTAGFFTLGRHATLLMAKGSANPPGTFADIAYDTPAVAVAGEPAAHITQSRFNVAGITTPEVMAFVRMQIGEGASGGGRGVPGHGTFEADHYCYRFNALRDVYASGVSVGNGAARMGPIALQGVSDFRIEWADDSGGAAWFGRGNPKEGELRAPSVIEPVRGAGSAGGDDYVAIFSFDTARGEWPSALRVSFRVNDRNGRLPGGRLFTQVLKLPE